ncbi:uncharacterized protein CLUP02_16827 [Colletotrichum lupini]|uniref:Uncharacterized protein n=1 Tax=Colletotrichum lupini TaxID=145971 RepID=A0A9Q8T9B7_9PEZI|nr:uncharacterized protein CLUP02_16827 [Colletotrichum lupini]UQC91293.1 hypothetical protein CLUP02_16827 [Colletotrichum lupini]
MEQNPLCISGVVNKELKKVSGDAHETFSSDGRINEHIGQLIESRRIIAPISPFWRPDNRKRSRMGQKSCQSWCRRSSYYALFPRRRERQINNVFRPQTGGLRALNYSALAWCVVPLSHCNSLYNSTLCAEMVTELALLDRYMRRTFRSKLASIALKLTRRRVQITVQRFETNKFCLIVKCHHISAHARPKLPRRNGIRAAFGDAAMHLMEVVQEMDPENIILKPNPRNQRSDGWVFERPLKFPEKILTNGSWIFVLIANSALMTSCKRKVLESGTLLELSPSASGVKRRQSHNINNEDLGNQSYRPLLKNLLPLSNPRTKKASHTKMSSGNNDPDHATKQAYPKTSSLIVENA